MELLFFSSRRFLSIKYIRLLNSCSYCSLHFPSVFPPISQHFMLGVINIYIPPRARTNKLYFSGSRKQLQSFAFRPLSPRLSSFPCLSPLPLDNVSSNNFIAKQTYSHRYSRTHAHPRARTHTNANANKH